MWSISVGLICFFATTCAGEDPAVECSTNSIADNGDDKCTLLQGGVGVVSHHQEDKHEKDEHEKLHQSITEVADKKDKHKKDEHEKLHQDSKEVAHKKGWPGDILKHITDAIGGVDKLEKDFDGIKSAVATFAHEVHKAVHDLTENVKDDMHIEAVMTQVEATWNTIHESAMKLFDALEKATETFTATIGKVAPDQFSSAVKQSLDQVTSKAKHFADSFSHAADRLMKVNRTMVCATVKDNLDAMHHRVQGLVKEATGLTAKELNQDIRTAVKLLPDSIKNEVDKILAKADEAAERLKSSTSSIMQEISMGISQAFKGHCTELQSGAGRLEVGFLSALLIPLLGFVI